MPDAPQPIAVPLTTRCGLCGTAIRRTWESRPGSLIVNPWLHVVPDDSHTPTPEVLS